MNTETGRGLGILLKDAYQWTFNPQPCCCESAPWPLKPYPTPFHRLLRALLTLFLRCPPWRAACSGCVTRPWIILLSWTYLAEQRRGGKERPLVLVLRRSTTRTRYVTCWCRLGCGATRFRKGEIPRVARTERIKPSSAEQCRKHPEPLIRGDRLHCESNIPLGQGNKEMKDEDART